MTLPVYLDQTATTAIDPDVQRIYTERLDSHYANPASLHEPGLQCEKLLSDSRRQISQAIGQQSGHLILTSGGSESINLAIKGFLEANTRLPQRIIISAGEHAAVYETALYYQQKGFAVDILPLRPHGAVDLDALREALQQPAALLSLIHVNNETGAENPVSEIVRLRSRFQPDLAIHLDAVQAVGKIPFSFHRLGVDMVSGSGHKIGAPKSIGWLSTRPKIRLAPLIHGGSQQNGLRAGTENPPLAAALARALQIAVGQQAERREHTAGLRHFFLRELENNRIKYHVIAAETAVPQILAVSFPGLRAEVLLRALAARGVYISAGAACSSKKKRRENRVLAAMGLPAAVRESTVRISFSHNHSEADLAEVVSALAICQQQLIRL